MRNWTKPRAEVLKIAAQLIVERECDLDGVVESLCHAYYHGENRPIAQGMFRNSLGPIVGKMQWAKRLAEYQELDDMASQLESEGWRWLDAGDGSGIWAHAESGRDVNNLGGNFDTKRIGAYRTYNSATRAALLANLHA